MIQFLMYLYTKNIIKYKIIINIKHMNKIVFNFYQQQ